MFCCSMLRRWPLLVASDLARCLVMSRVMVRPGQDLKQVATLDGTEESGGQWTECASVEESCEVSLGSDVFDCTVC